MAWMLAAAVEQLQSAERLQRQFFRVGSARAVPCWEPPVDMFECGDGVVVLVALPGVTADRFEVDLEDSVLEVRGDRSFAPEMTAGQIHRLEIPYGRFERRIVLPYGPFRLVDMQLEHGCLQLQLERLP
jgi:HSP20 family molecular chaperone IbpA